MNSCLYACKISHTRKTPKEHKFVHGHFMFYLWLDEIADALSELRLFGTALGALYRFIETDYLPLANSSLSLKDRVREIAQAQGVSEKIESISLLTNVRLFGYVFNPVSLFFCFGQNQNAICCIVEVGNTFGEKKVFFLNAIRDGVFVSTQQKFFYVSPFAELDHYFDFRIAVPSENLSIFIDTVSANNVSKMPGVNQIVTSLTGKRSPLTDSNIIVMSLKFPLVTLRVIWLIHWHAFLLWKKGLKFHRKEEKTSFQTEVLQPHHSLKEAANRQP